MIAVDRAVVVDTTRVFPPTGSRRDTLPLWVKSGGVQLDAWLPGLQTGGFDEMTAPASLADRRVEDLETLKRRPQHDRLSAAGHDHTHVWCPSWFDARATKKTSDFAPVLVVRVNPIGRLQRPIWRERRERIITAALVGHAASAPKRSAVTSAG
ncbi:hypothetical protein [Mycolicibacterium sp. CBMA 226]|uniref:hypothetical protein n=1 Tax=Mycolicibacterium sp. CBMA 226 TaxID=2606611 RepID=UPI0012DCC27A|nr:hypothetical protein [Mycolicibacterium sp. CBMA 226]MUL79018.1 hypothetical protein [Mycolicibacterium sp. CBMA 226]